MDRHFDRMLISIARALLKRPKILVLLHPPSASEIDSKLLVVLERICHYRTALIFTASSMFASHFSPDKTIYFHSSDSNVPSLLFDHRVHSCYSLASAAPPPPLRSSHLAHSLPSLREVDCSIPSIDIHPTLSRVAFGISEHHRISSSSADFYLPPQNQSSSTQTTCLPVSAALKLKLILFHLWTCRTISTYSLFGGILVGALGGGCIWFPMLSVLSAELFKLSMTAGASERESMAILFEGIKVFLAVSFICCLLLFCHLYQSGCWTAKI